MTTTPTPTLQKTTHEVEIDGQRFLLKRPGRGGIGRIALRVAQRVAGDPHLAQMDGRGIEMEAVLHEYLETGPDAWRLKDAKGNPVLDSGRPVWTFEDADPDLFGRVGEAAVAFHASFRAVDSRFGLQGSVNT